MTQLANANLLDDSVANSSSLKSKRIYRTAQTAVNPQPKREKIEVKKEVEENYDDSEYEDAVEERTDNFKRFEPNVSAKKTVAQRIDSSSSDDDSKILGMSKPMFYTILGVVVIAGGVWAYNKFMKKPKIKIADGLGDSANAIGSMANPPNTNF